MLAVEKCPECGTVVEIKTYNDGNCPRCGTVYSWQPVGIENAEHIDGPHDFVSWRTKRTSVSDEIITPMKAVHEEGMKLTHLVTDAIDNAEI